MSDEVARALRGAGASTQEAEELRSVAERLGIRLQAMHPDAGGDPSSRLFRHEVADRATGERVAKELSACSGVEGAYWKPAEEPP